MPPSRVDWRLRLRLRQPQRIAPRRLRSFIASAMAYPKLSTLPSNAQTVEVAVRRRTHKLPIMMIIGTGKTI